MKMHINRRNFLLGSLSTTAMVVAPLSLKANSDTEQQKSTKYIHCGAMNHTNLRHFYYKRGSGDKS